MSSTAPTGDGVLCLGVAPGAPCPERRHSAYLHTLGGQCLLMDAGVGVSGALAAAGVGPDEPGHVLLSHQHSDHVGGFSMLVQGWWVNGRRRPLHVHAPAKAIASLRSWLEATLLFPELIGFPIEWHPLEAGQETHLGTMRVTPYRTTHLEGLERAYGAGHPGVCFEAFSFVLSAGDRRVGHTADIGAVADLEPMLGQPLDLLVCEVSHVEPEPLFARLASATVGRLVLIHLDRRWWADPDALITLARRHLGSRDVRIARDGDRIGLAD